MMISDVLVLLSLSVVSDFIQSIPASRNPVHQLPLQKYVPLSSYSYSTTAASFG